MNGLQNIYIGNQKANNNINEINGHYCIIDEEKYYQISNVNEMRPFFMSIVSNSNHWMFISSNGALTAGRKNTDFSLFPYYTDDKITESAETTGSKSIFIINQNNQKHLWEPFSQHQAGIYNISQNLYKNIYGNKIIFEEINHDLQVSYRYQWNMSDKFGFVKKSTLINLANNDIVISILDGIQNIIPYGVPCDLQNGTSNLVDAYKRSELDENSGLGIFALSAIIVDKAEPSEALKANIVWNLGVEKTQILLSSLQLNNFKKGNFLTQETDIKGEKGAYFIHSEINLAANEQKQWLIIADVNHNHSSIVQLSNRIKNDQNLFQTIQQDIFEGTQQLIKFVAASDGLQLTEDTLKDTRHFSNTLFNIMRGGIFDNNYQINKQDFTQYLHKANKELFSSKKHVIEQLSSEFSYHTLSQTAEKTNDIHFNRLCTEYLPLMFSRRHGDPSRPWNKFSINTRSENDGTKVLDYEGNWRDIFQNWEALAHSYPSFLEGMISKFLNASTFDGYNPYRITKDGFDWETIEPENPWSYIGYWGDHQIIYLLKLLEIFENHYPAKFKSYFQHEVFVYANVPYKIKKYEDILRNPKDTIEFDEKSDRNIRKKREQLGADGALLENKNGKIHSVTFIEKILAITLAKMSNFIPEGGIWMNTQRPEWNDANNALVGNGVSMVTLYYLRRFLYFFKQVFANIETNQFSISSELEICFKKIMFTLEKFHYLLEKSISDKDRKSVLDNLSKPVSDYRIEIYENYFNGKKTDISIEELRKFVEISITYIEHSIKANKREDDLYHAYNLMTLQNEDEISISHLSEMLEGQVAVLSSGYLSSAETLSLLYNLKKSKLYREDQNSYILYPNKNLPRFLQKNNISENSISTSELLKELMLEGNVQIIEKDIDGHFHFNGNLKNATDLNIALLNISNFKYQELIDKEKNLILDIFEQTFNHKAFTGRSGTFFAYEGLGSIYWHMVSKLQLAVQECCFRAVNNNEKKDIINKLSAFYYDISEGVGVHKSPSQYGAFPTDPYSHTPEGKGAKQPGMTGQVKEDILSRFGEFGIFVKKGEICFNPYLLKQEEFLSNTTTFEYFNVHSEKKEITVEKNSICYTYCQIPIIYQIAENNYLEIKLNDDTNTVVSTLTIDEQTSNDIFNRTGKVISISVYIKI